MNYENMSFDELRELASNNPQEFKKIPTDHLRKVAIEHEIEEAKKNGHYIDDSGIAIFKED